MKKFICNLDPSVRGEGVGEYTLSDMPVTFQRSIRCSALPHNNRETYSAPQRFPRGRGDPGISNLYLLKNLIVEYGV